MAQFLQKIPKIAFIAELTAKSHHGILMGMRQYEQMYGPWWIRLFPQKDKELRKAKLIAWKPDGIVAHVTTDFVASLIIQANVPSILIDLWAKFLEKDHPLSHFSQVRGDSETVGIIAADFFLKRRFTHFAFVPEINDVLWSQCRQKTYTNRLNQAGYSCEIYRYSKPVQNPWAELKLMSQWLQSLPRPLALFAANDQVASQVADACRGCGISIPDDISLLGVDNDQIQCDAIDPSLTSIARNYRGAGFCTANHLDLLIHGKTSERRIIPIEVLNIMERQSTRIMNTDDPVVLEAMSFIHVNSGIGMNVQNVVRHLNISRRSLELRFRSIIGHTVHQEIEKKRLDKIKSFLLDTDMSIKEIAVTCSFSDEMYLANWFRKKVGTTMNKFRQRNRAIRQHFVEKQTPHFENE